MGRVSQFVDFINQDNIPEANENCEQCKYNQEVNQYY